MGDKRYIISEAAEKVGIEPHVLRYWEDELGLSVARNELGHRYYTEEQINLFRQIKELKKTGFQLKAVKSVLGTNFNPDSAPMDATSGRETEKQESSADEIHSSAFGDSVPEDEDREKKELDCTTNVVHMPVKTAATSPADNTVTTSADNERIAQFEEIMGEIIGRALIANKDKLGEDITKNVSDRIIKEMDYLLRMREESEDERFRKLDETIRMTQRGNREAAASREGKKRKLFGKKF